MTSIADDFLFPPFSERTEPRLTLPLCRRDGKRLGGGFEKRTSVADIVHAERGLTKRDGSLDDRGRMVEKTIPERGNAKRRHDATVRPRPKVFFLFSDFGLTRPWPFPCDTRRTSCSRAFRATCACCRSRSRASPRNDLGPRAKEVVEIVLALENPVQAFRHRGLMAVRLLGHARQPAEGGEHLTS